MGAAGFSTLTAFRAIRHSGLWLWTAAAVTILVAVQASTGASQLTEVDSINLVEGLEDFNPAVDQPHPPGYPLVILSAHMLSWAGGAVEAFLAVTLVASALAVAGTYLLGRAMFGRSAGTIAAILLLATPLFLYYLGVVSVYPTEAAATAFLALIAYRVATQSGRVWSLSLFPALALAGGFRPTIIGLMLPVCAFAIAIGRPSHADLARGFLVGGLIVASWAVPTLTASGGFEAYSDRSSELYENAAEKTSVLYGASPREAASNVGAVVAASAIVALPAAVLIGLLALSGRRPRPAGSWVEWGLLATWSIPYLALYTFVHFGKPGYMLAVMPAFSVAGSGLVGSPRRAVATALGVLAGALAFFWLAPHLSLPNKLPTYAPTANSIEVADVEARGLERIASSCGPETCTLISLPQSERWWGDRNPHSLASAYAEEARVLELPEAIEAGPGLGTALWVGEEVPDAVADHADEEGMIGPWSVYRSTGPVTAEIVRSLSDPA